MINQTDKRSDKQNRAGKAPVDAYHRKASTHGDPDFIARLNLCADLAGSVNALAKRAGISQGGIRRYFNGGEPTRPVLIAMAAATGVSLMWLATGEGPMMLADLQAQKTEHEAEAESHGELDLDLLEGLVATVRQALMDAQIDLPPEAEGKVIRLLYLGGLEYGKIDRKMVSEVIRLVA